MVEVHARLVEACRAEMARSSDLRVRFGQRVRELRRRRSLTLEQLGEGATLSDKFIQAVETGRQMPTVATIEKLARGLGVLPAELFTAEDRTPRASRARARELIAEASDADVVRIVRILEAVLH